MPMEKASAAAKNTSGPYKNSMLLSPILRLATSQLGCSLGTNYAVFDMLILKSGTDHDHGQSLGGCPEA